MGLNRMIVENVSCVVSYLSLATDSYMARWVLDPEGYPYLLLNAPKESNQLKVTRKCKCLFRFYIKAIKIRLDIV